jgi:hypothetical protein
MYVGGGLWRLKWYCCSAIDRTLDVSIDSDYIIASAMHNGSKCYRLRCMDTLGMYLPIYLSIYVSIYLSIYLTVYLSMNLCINLLTVEASSSFIDKNCSDHLAYGIDTIDRELIKDTNRYLSTIYLSIYLSIYSTYLILSIYLCLLEIGSLLLHVLSMITPYIFGIQKFRLILNYIHRYYDNND